MQEGGVRGGPPQTEMGGVTAETGHAPVHIHMLCKEKLDSAITLLEEKSMKHTLNGTHVKYSEDKCEQAPFWSIPEIRAPF